MFEVLKLIENTNVSLSVSNNMDFCSRKNHTLGKLCRTCEKQNFQNILKDDKNITKIRKLNVFVNKHCFRIFASAESSTSCPGRNQVDGLPPASNCFVIRLVAHLDAVRYAGMYELMSFED